MDHLKEGIGLRGYGQRDPLTEYKKEAFDLFQDMVEHLKEAVIEQLFKVRIMRDEAAAEPALRRRLPPTRWQESRGSARRVEPAGPAARAARAPSPARPPARRSAATIPAVRLRQEVQECCFLKGA